MEYHKFSLRKRGKTECPACKRKTFVLYIDGFGNPLHPTVGKCDRAYNCQHHYTPKQYFTEHSNSAFDKKITHFIIAQLGRFVVINILCFCHFSKEL